jgi:hypothetical protein
VVYGPDNDDGFFDDNGKKATSIAPTPTDDASIARRVDGADTDRSGDDFVLLDRPTPGASNARDEDCAGMDDVRINELLPDPDGADEGNEWIELYGAQLVALDGWRIEWGTSEFGSGFDFPAGTTIGPGSFLVVGGSADADLAAPLALGNAGSSSDAVRLRHCGGAWRTPSCTALATPMAGSTTRESKRRARRLLRSMDSRSRVGPTASTATCAARTSPGRAARRAPRIPPPPCACPVDSP